VRSMEATVGFGELISILERQQSRDLRKRNL